MTKVEPELYPEVCTMATPQHDSRPHTPPELTMRHEYILPQTWNSFAPLPYSMDTQVHPVGSNIYHATSLPDNDVTGGGTSEVRSTNHERYHDTAHHRGLTEVYLAPLTFEDHNCYIYCEAPSYPLYLSNPFHDSRLRYPQAAETQFHYPTTADTAGTSTSPSHFGSTPDYNYIPRPKNQAERARLRAHDKTCIRYLTCPCGKTFNKHWHLRRHRKMCYLFNRNVERSLICDCGRHFATSEDLDQHVTTSRKHQRDMTRDQFVEGEEVDSGEEGSDDSDEDEGSHDAREVGSRCGSSINTAEREAMEHQSIQGEENKDCNRDGKSRVVAEGLRAEAEAFLPSWLVVSEINK